MHVGDDSAHWTVAQLATMLRWEGRAHVEAKLAPFVLIASVDERGEPAAWSFTTVAVDVGALREGPDGRYLSGRELVYPVRKRSIRFPDTILVGRAGSNDICVDDPSISKLHARLRTANAVLTLEDASSRNGTFVDGERVRGQVVLRQGDIVRFGTYGLRVQSLTQLMDDLPRVLGAT